jgi:hypothetical protein
VLYVSLYHVRYISQYMKLLIVYFSPPFHAVTRNDMKILLTLTYITSRHLASVRYTNVYSAKLRLLSRHC